VDADLHRHSARGGSVEQHGAVELGHLRDTIDLGAKLRELRLDVAALVGAQGAVGGLDSQLAHTADDALHLVHRALGDLRHADAVVRVALRLRDAADVRLEVLADAKSRRIIGGAVDALSRGQPLNALIELSLADPELPLGAQGGDVCEKCDCHLSESSGNFADLVDFVR
jgi:hypothetical protein